MEKAPIESYATRLRQLRGIAGATQFDVERIAGINRTRLSMAECGHLQLREWEYAAVENALLRVIRERAAQFAGVLELEQEINLQNRGLSTA